MRQITRASNERHNFDSFQLQSLKERRSGSSTAESGSDFFMITHPIPDNRAASCRPEETEKWTAKHHKHKRNLSLEKTLNVSTTSTAPQVENHTVAYVNVSAGIATASNEVSSALPVNSTSMVESSVNQKRNNFKIKQT